MECISTGINLLLLAVGAYDGETAAYTELAQVSQPSDDPLVQSLYFNSGGDRLWQFLHAVEHD
ncbi:MAG UNVERIFIED_CONTAM: hypothetical protein LVT10_01765 [Anaerolineae bacterium]